MTFSKSQLDKLGDRLRSQTLQPGDEDALAEFRLGHSPSLDEVQTRIRHALGIESSGRLKAPESIVAKLHRQTIKLSQVGDIAGCRLTVDDLSDQERRLIAVRALFPGSVEKDYRDRSQNGYRAVHLLVRSSSARRVEIQVRTRAQNAWANVSEVLAGRIDPALKYGAGPESARELLSGLSAWCHLLDWSLETAEKIHAVVVHLRRRETLDLRDAEEFRDHPGIVSLEQLLTQERERTAMMARGFHEICERVIQEARR